MFSFKSHATLEGGIDDFHFINMSTSSGRSSDLSKGPHLVIGRAPTLHLEFYKQEIQSHKVMSVASAHMISQQKD